MGVIKVIHDRDMCIANFLRKSLIKKPSSRNLAAARPLIGCAMRKEKQVLV